ncbi:MAG TPA: sugar transferase [Gammaproteobacteria bacterium]|nr:sugar transferase [Gammaproteobacteria bacterium]
MITKRLFDIALAVPGLLFLSPLLLLIILCIRLDSQGPIFFCQERVGLNGHVFRIFKFRTMVVDAENHGPQLTIGLDSRVTRCGRILRKYKLDELPQLFNVLKGDMSLVGPRPEVPRYIAFYPEEALQVVLSVPPGITDPASIRFIDENTLLADVSDPETYYIEKLLPEKISAYIEYVSNRSMMGDIQVLWQTLVRILR